MAARIQAAFYTLAKKNLMRHNHLLYEALVAAKVTARARRLKCQDNFASALA